MQYAPFYEQFRELALKETRSFTVFDGHPDLPADEYGLVELYCDDEGCDCQRVMFEVLSRKRNKSVAYIAYGWASAGFYRKWTKSGDPDIALHMRGPVLNELSPQSELAAALLTVVRDTVLKDAAYVERLKRHYRLFKEKVDPKHFPKIDSVKRVAVEKPKSKKRKRN